MHHSEGMSQTQPPLTSAQVCSEFGCNRSTLTRWVDSGFITAAHQLPGSTGAFLFTAEEVARVKPEALARLAKRSTTAVSA